jgi:hypothetical protein
MEMVINSWSFRSQSLWDLSYTLQVDLQNIFLSATPTTIEGSLAGREYSGLQ